MRITHLLVVLLIAVAGTTSAPAQSQEQPARPNVILMMADDLAYNDLSSYGSDRISTPRLDALAAQGMRLTSYYAGSSVCSPSRMGLMSGAYPARLGWQWGVMGYGMAMNSGLSSDVFTIAEAFRAGGYRTALSGKWHLGSRNMAPENQGFDSAYYIFMSNNQGRDMYRDGELVQADWDNRRLTETFAQEAVRVINEDSDQPFFLYLPWSAPHFPAEAHPDWRGRSAIGEFGDVVEELDARIGHILDALEARGIADNTVVIFTSDNGRQRGQNDNLTAPLSGMKWESREGGSRVPFIIRYPGVVPADATSDAIVSALDLYPTLTNVCGITLDRDSIVQPMDGVDVWSTLAGGGINDSDPRTELLYWHGKGQATALRQGDWKLFFNAGQLNAHLGDPDVSAGPLLFNLAQDIGETTDVSGQHPERVQAMLARARELLAEVYANQVPLGAWQGVDETTPPLRARDVWGQWLE